MSVCVCELASAIITMAAAAAALLFELLTQLGMR